MPYLCRPVTGERDALAAYLAYQHDVLRATAHGMTDEQAGLAPTASPMSVGTILKHVIRVEHNWLASVRTAPGLVDWPSGEAAAAAYAEAWTWHPHDTLAAVLEAYDAIGAEVLDAVRSTDLDTPFPVFESGWTPTDVEAWSVRWVWLHLIEELARHAGHADIIREAVDGEKSWTLLAGQDAAWAAQPVGQSAE